MPPKAHAELGASSSARWIACPGSVPLSRPYERRSSVYASEGSVAHALCESALAGEELTAVGTSVEYDGHVVLITREMHDAVETYVTALAPIIERSSWSATEQQVHIDNDKGAELYGTADCLAIDGDTLVVGDFKYGKGVKVDVEDNTQLLFYALAAWDTLLAEDQKRLRGVRNIRLVICQPRIDGPALKDWTINVLDLLMWSDEVLMPAVSRIMQGDETLNIGVYCKFCPALSGCPKQHAQAVEAGRMAFDDAYDEPGFGSNSAAITPEELGQRLALLRSLQTYLKGLEDEVLTLMRDGREVPGWKLVAGRSLRKWVGEDMPVAHEICRRTSASEKLLYDLMKEPALRSPAQVEKVLKRYKFDPKVTLDGLVDKPPGKPALVGVDDPRPPLPLTAAAEGFDDYGELGEL